METPICIPNAHYDWNVIDEDSFKQRSLKVFNQVSSALVKTLGPYGKSTMIEKFGESHITKDGWAVLKKLRFTDDINNHILQLLLSISSQVIIKVGDGSTSSIVAADSIFNNLDKCESLKHIRSKDLIDIISRCITKITDLILSKSIKIDPISDPDFKDIYKLAMISTNGNIEISEMIQYIYKETSNPSIEFSKSKTNKTSFEIIDGYKCLITYLDSIFATNDSGICEITKPLILMFDHKIEVSHYTQIIQPVIQLALANNKRLVVIAPYYDKHLQDTIRTSINIEFRATQKCTTVYARASLINNITNEYYNDFCMMTGGMMITENTALDLIEGRITLDNQYIGEVDKISIGPNTTFISGFSKRDASQFIQYTNDANAKYTKVEENLTQRGVINSELYELKQRISKLKGKMGIINVGGYSSLEKENTFDLVEDAIKACESAYRYGYNIGGNLIIPIIIRELFETDETLSGIDKEVLTLIEISFREVFAKVLKNKYALDKTIGDIDSYISTIIDYCVTKRICWDLVNEYFSNDIINPSHTDIEILKAATSIVALLMSSNQYISIKTATE